MEVSRKDVESNGGELKVGAISVIGAGAWGTALAIHLERAGHSVRLWVRESDLVARIRDARINDLYLPNVKIPPRVDPTDDLEYALKDTSIVLSVVPAQHARKVLRKMAPIGLSGRPVVVASKGIEEGSLCLPLDVVRDELGESQPRAVLSGPSFAEEVAAGKPTALSLASDDAEVCRSVQAALSSESLRVYASDDPLGVQLAGAMKNVIAIATGIADSLEMGNSAQAALITRGLAEITRLGGAMGGQRATFAGLAGLGDLVLTCTGNLSRNRRFGCQIGLGKSVESILESTRSVVEGLYTTRAASRLARKHGVEIPIVEELHRVLFEGGVAAESLERLMRRPLSKEERPHRVGS